MKAKKELFYLDYNATTQIDKRVLDAMMAFHTNEFGNANSSHQFETFVIALDEVAAFSSVVFLSENSILKSKWIWLLMQSKM